MNNKISRAMTVLAALALLFSQFVVSGQAAPASLPTVPVTFTILHTNDFHGNLEQNSGNSTSNPGMARVAKVINDVRTAVGADNVLLLDAGDEMQGSLLSNIQKGAPTIAVYNAMGYAAATFGNHEFDWGQDVLAQRVSEASYPYLSANIVINDTGNCTTAGWTSPSFAQPYVVKTVGTASNTINVGIIGVTTTETPIITVASATEGLCFKDPAESIKHYYDEIKANADVIVVLSHLGFADGGYGYGIPIYGDQTLAQKLITAGKPVNLIIGGHSHTDVALPAPVVGGKTTVVQARYNGRQVGRADITVQPDGAVSVSWSKLAPTSSGAPDPTVEALIGTYTSDPAYQALIGEKIGWTNVPIARNYEGDSLMGYFVNDAIYSDLNTDAVAENDVDMAFNNPGGLRADLACDAPPCLLTYGALFSVLPFGNQTVVGDMTGAQIMELLNQSASLSKGSIQPAGMRFKFYNYRVWSSSTAFRTWAWGAFDVCVVSKSSGNCEPLDLKKTYRVATNEFLAPAGQDNFTAFKYMTNISYWGDMLDGVNRWVKATYTADQPYNGVLDGRITRDGDDTTGNIIPITILHNNDSHGNLPKTTYVGYTQLASLIQQERAYNPTRTILLNGGDQIQGDAMMYYFKSAPSGYAADGTVLPPNLQIHPMVAVMNSLGYDAMTLGNHEFNFGSATFTGIFKQAQFPLLGANVADTGAYGFSQVGPGGQGVQPYIEKDLDGIKIAILGITNHRVPNYELPSNIVGLSFSDPLATAQQYADELRTKDDVVIALTHIGFTENPSSVEVDKNVDTNMAAQVSGLDAIIGSHSHTDPSKQTAYSGIYKYLPTILGGPDNTPVIVSQAYRYNNYLGEVILGVRAKAGGGYEVVSRAGQYIAVTASTPEDAATKAIVDPYVAQLNTYNNKVIGSTTVAIDTLQAFTQETNGANLQADASVWELQQHGVTPDFHLSGAMTNKVINAGTLKISDMFAGMPYENSLVVLRMNGPQLKAVLERAFRNYYYYKHVPGYGGYSYYTTCMLDTSSIGRITYNDLYPAAYDPAKSYVVSLAVNGHEIDFTDASTYYKVSTVNYLAAGSCNFNNAGVSLWPLDQIVADTQYYVRDAVIDYITAMSTVSPVIEGRLNFISDTTPPAITINAPTASDYLHPASLTIDFIVTDDIAGVKTEEALLDGVAVLNGQNIDLYTLALGSHTFTANAVDKAGNASTQSVEFDVTATIDSLTTAVERFYQDGSIKNKGTYYSLLQELKTASKSQKPEVTSNILNAFIQYVRVQRGRHIKSQAADLLIADAQWVIRHLADTTPPYIKIVSPQAISYHHHSILRIDFGVFDLITGIQEVSATLDGVPVVDHQKIDLRTLARGEHVFTVSAMDYAGNTSTKTVTFKVK